uniref:Uncharacterized protein n=1 Tax=Rhizophora mucronata TaxID=61149 RepID=A0A2P2PBJ7_RHIMU
MAREKKEKGKGSSNIYFLQQVWITFLTNI